MASCVLVHGGGHVGWCSQPVARILRSQGHEACAGRRPAWGEREHLLSSAVDLGMRVTAGGRGALVHDHRAVAEMLLRLACP